MAQIGIMIKATVLIVIIGVISSHQAAVIVNEAPPQILTVNLSNGSVHHIDLSEDLKEESRRFGSTKVELICPDDVEPHIKLNLFTPHNKNVGYLLTNSSILDANLDPDVTTTVISHGWLDTGNSPWMIKMKNKYLNSTSNNVILVNWGRYSKDLYNIAAKKTREIGACVGQTLLALFDAEKTDANKVHIVGHSLGAHIAGFAGKTIQARSTSKVSRITALDAAGPLFAFPIWKSDSKRLSRKDAQFVDAIHTCGGVFGIKRAFADADFFPNGGTGIQPGCGIIKNDICSHLRSHTYYHESINSVNFVARQCDSYKHYNKGKCDKYRAAPMGLYTPFGLSGTFYLDTNTESLFAIG